MLPYEPQHEPAPRPDPVSNARRQSLRELFSDLDDSLQTALGLRNRIETERKTQSELIQAIDSLARLMPAADRRKITERLANSELAQKAMGRPPHPTRGTSPRLRAVKHWLVREDPESFRVCELTAVLRRHGHQMPPEYAANACRELMHQGILRRLSRGCYAPIRAHPELCRMINEELDRKVRRFVQSG